MTEKRKTIMDRLGTAMESMTEEALNNLLLVGEGMVIMGNIVVNRNPQNTSEPDHNKKVR